MELEFLVIAQDRLGKAAKRGFLVCYKPRGSQWGRKECLPLFDLVPFEGVEQEADYVLAHCRYDFDARRFVHLSIEGAGSTESQNDEMPMVEEGAEYDPAQVPSEYDFAEALVVQKQVAEELAGTTVANSCSYMEPKHLIGKMSETETRVYFFKLFWPERADPQVRVLLDELKRGSYGTIREAMAAVDPVVYGRVAATMTAEDRQWYKDVWKLQWTDAEPQTPSVER